MPRSRTPSLPGGPRAPRARPRPPVARPSVRLQGLPGARPGALPATLLPQLATLVNAAPAGDAWLHEVKYDGYRLLARIEGGQARVFTRRGNDWTERFPRLAERLAALPCESAVVDGELVVLAENGVTSFGALQSALGAGDEDALVLFLFDLLHLDGVDLRETPQIDRKERLRELLAGAAAENDAPLLRFSDHLVGQGPEFHAQACQWGLEGIVSKRADAPYRSRRTRDWLKVKCARRQEFVVGGFTEPEGARVGLGSLVLGYYDEDGRLRHAGRVGTGFDEATLRALHRRLAPAEVADSPFADLKRRRDTHWVEPRLVVEVSFLEWTDDGSLRHATFKGVREDKEPREVRREQAVLAPTAAPLGLAPSPAEEDGSPSDKPGKTAKVRPSSSTTARKRVASKPTAASRAPYPAPSASPAGRNGRSKGEAEVAGVRLSHPERVVDRTSGLTKLDQARYYEAVGEWMLPHVGNRLLTLVRCPEGVGGECFFQKHAYEGFPAAIRRVPLEEEDGDSRVYTTVDSVAGLVALAQFGVMEVHVWGSRADRPERPDRIVMDLDPAPDVPWARVAQGALDVRERLASLGLASFLKTTGGKGLHVVVPLARRSTWDEVKGFARALAVEVSAGRPGQYLTKSTLSARKGKIFIDYLRNGRGATAVSAYSLRSRPGAPASVPLHWDELDSRALHNLSPAEVMRRVATLRADPWEGFEAASRQVLTRAMRREIGAE